MGEVRYMISEAAKKVQVESHVLRYWEEELGLEIDRTDMGHRYYTEDDIQLFLCIQKLKNEGMLLRDLKPMIPELTATRKRLNAARLEKERKSAHEAEAAPTSGGDADLSQTAGSASGEGADLPQTAVPVSASPAEAPVSAELAMSPDEAPVSAELAASPDEVSVSAGLAAPGAEVVQMTQLEQVRSLIGDVLTDVVTANNETLKKDISRKVTADVIREMDFLFQAKERREEEHFRKLDMLIRQQQTSRRETAKVTPIGRLKKLLT